MGIGLARKKQKIKENLATVESYRSYGYDLAMAKVHLANAYANAVNEFPVRSQELRCLKAANVKVSDAQTRLEVSCRTKFGNYYSAEDIHNMFSRQDVSYIRDTNGYNDITITPF